MAACGVSHTPGSALAWVLVLIVVGIVAIVEFKFKSDGEVVKLTDKDTTTQAKLDKLAEMAIFPAFAVRWRQMFLASALGATLVLVMLKACSCFQTSNSLLSLWIMLFSAQFLSSFALTNYKAFHGPQRIHVHQATKLRAELARMCDVHDIGP